MTHRFPDFYRKAPFRGSHQWREQSAGERDAAGAGDAGFGDAGFGDAMVGGEAELESDGVDGATLQLIKEAANRQWRQIQDMGIETSHLMNLAGAIWEVLKFGSDPDADSEPDFEAGQVSGHSLQSLMTQGMVIPAEITAACSPLSEVPARQVPEGTIKLGTASQPGADSGEPIVVSLASFFEFSFDVSEALNQMVENHRQN